MRYKFRAVIRLRRFKVKEAGNRRVNVVMGTYSTLKVETVMPIIIEDKRTIGHIAKYVGSLKEVRREISFKATNICEVKEAGFTD